MALKVVTVHIRPGESVSEPADCTEGTIIRIAAPRDDWDGANITFEVSTDDGDYYHALVDSNGEEIMMPVKVGCSTLVRETEGLMPSWYRIRSGTMDEPVEQQGDRDFSFVLLVPDAPGGAVASAARAKTAAAPHKR